MVRLQLTTEIAAPIERCFDLSRSIDLHVKSVDWSSEQAIAGVTTGLIGSGEEVTWRARHFGVMISHTSRITAYERPIYFQDAMLRGAFRSFCHDHYFESREGHTHHARRCKVCRAAWDSGSNCRENAGRASYARLAEAAQCGNKTRRRKPRLASIPPLANLANNPCRDVAQLRLGQRPTAVNLLRKPRSGRYPHLPNLNGGKNWLKTSVAKIDW